MDSGITPLNAQQTAEQEQEASHEGYVRRVLIGLDQAANVILDGQPDQTISSRDAIAAEHGNGPAKMLAHVLDAFEPDHGAKAVAGDEERAKLVEQTEESSGLIQE